MTETYHASKGQQEKLTALRTCIRELESLAVAFSGGVDSTFLLRVAHEELGDRCLAVTVTSGTFPGRELAEADEFCRREGIRQLLVESRELEIEEFRQNPPNRCYICKREIFGEILRLVRREGLAAVAEGSNMDDLGDYRPGLQAVAELGIKSPLRECGLYKEDIRALSREMGLPTFNKPSFACLASRFAYGETITAEKLSMVDRAEQLLLGLEFRQFRVRIHGTMARIEVLPEDFDRLLENRLLVVQKLKEYGFTYVSMDLQGYRTGSMNETL